MRHYAAGSLVVNCVAGLAKLRKVVFLAENSGVLGVVPTIVVGTLAFSTGNILMTVENTLVDWLGYGRNSSKPPARDDITPPVLLPSMSRNFMSIALLVTTEELSLSLPLCG